MKILINTPSINKLAGVSNFYRVLRPSFPGYVHYFTIHVSQRGAKKMVAFGIDVFRFVFNMMFGGVDTVLLNPSLDKNAVLRDGVYAWIAKRVFKKRLFVQWHGWHLDYEKEVEKKGIQWFLEQLFCADGMCVLGSAFKNTLIRWGYPEDKIHLTTTVIEDSLCSASKEYSSNNVYKILFLSRVVREKGVFEALDVLKILQVNMGTRINMVVAGDGPALISAKEYAKNIKVCNVDFRGYVYGIAKQKAFEDCDLYILPSYGEGMPCALLEAMGNGLPVITSAVGGIPDFFENGKMGFMLNSHNPKDYADAILSILNEPEKIEEMGSYNRLFATRNFVSSKVAERLLQILAKKD